MGVSTDETAMPVRRSVPDEDTECGHDEGDDSKRHQDPEHQRDQDQDGPGDHPYGDIGGEEQEDRAGASLGEAVVQDMPHRSS